MTISFKISTAQRLMIMAIMQAAVDRKIIKSSQKLDYAMSLMACIAQGCKLNLAKLASFDDFSLAHDLHGIHRHLDKDDGSPTEGQLRNCFLPRCGVIKQEVAV